MGKFSLYQRKGSDHFGWESMLEDATDPCMWTFAVAHVIQWFAKAWLVLVGMCLYVHWIGQLRSEAFQLLLALLN